MADQVDSGRWTRVRGSASSTGRVRTRGRDKWLLTVVPPATLPHSPPPACASGFAQGYGPSDRFFGGILAPLQPSLSAQIALIARDFGLPSVAGICVYFDVTSMSTYPPVKVTDETWAILWGRFFDENGDSLGASPLVGRIEFDIDKTRARWYAEWLTLPGGAAHTTVPNSESPELATGVLRARSSSGPSLSYILPQTPATSSCGSLRDSTHSSPHRSPDQRGPSETGGMILRDSATSEPRTSTPLTDPEPLSSPQKPSSASPSRLTSTAKEVDWSEQLDRLRDINEHALLDGVEHPSQLDSIEGTEKLGQLFGSLVDRTVQPSATEGCVPRATAPIESWAGSASEVAARAPRTPQAGLHQRRVPPSVDLPPKTLSPTAYPNLVIYPTPQASIGSLLLQPDSAMPSFASSPRLSAPSDSAGSDSDAAAELYESYYVPEAEQSSIPIVGRMQSSPVSNNAHGFADEQPAQLDPNALRVFSVLPSGNAAGHALPSPTIRGGLPLQAASQMSYEMVQAVDVIAMPPPPVIAPALDAEFGDEPCSPPFGGILLRSGFDEGDDSQSDGLGSDSDEERDVGACQTFDHLTANFAAQSSTEETPPEPFPLQ